MKKVKAFFYILIKSLIPERKYYHQLVKTPFKFSLKYFFILVIFLNLILLVYLINHYSYQKVYRLLFELERSLETYPPNLTIFIKNNRIFTNNNHPYFLWIKENENKKLLFSVIETADNQVINNLNSIIILSKSQVVIKNPTNYQIISVLKNNEIPELVIDKKLINQLIQTLQSLLKNLYWIYFLVVFSLFLIFSLVSFIATSFYLILASFLVFSYFKIFRKRHFHFKKVFQLSLHAVTFPLVTEYFAIIFPINLFFTKNFLLISSPLNNLFLIIVIFTLFTAIGVLKAYNHQK